MKTGAWAFFKPQLILKTVLLTNSEIMLHKSFRTSASTMSSDSITIWSYLSYSFHWFQERILFGFRTPRTGYSFRRSYETSNLERNELHLKIVRHKNLLCKEMLLGALYCIITRSGQKIFIVPQNLHPINQIVWSHHPHTSVSISDIWLMALQWYKQPIRVIATNTSYFHTNTSIDRLKC